MTTFTVSASLIEDQTIARYEISPSLQITQTYQYNNIDEAKEAPLAQQMLLY